MSEIPVSNKVREGLTQKMIEIIKERAEGSDSTRIYDGKPSKKLFIGNLSPQIPIQSVNNIYSKTSPSMMGIEVLIKKEDINQTILRITPHAVFYYRVFPTLEEQKEIHDLENQKRFYADMAEEDDRYDIEFDESTENGYFLRTVYQKINPDFSPIEIELRNILSKNFNAEGEFNSFKECIARVFKAYEKDDKKFKTRNYKGKTKKEKDEELIVPENVLDNQESYESFINEWGDKTPKPNWDAKLKYSIVDFDDECVKITVTLENTYFENREREAVDNSLFETELKITVFGAKFHPFVLDYLKDDYKYDGNIYANGINCSIEKISNTIIRTEHMPVFFQNKYKSKIIPGIEFEALIQDPVKHLESIYAKMYDAMREMETEYQTVDLTQRGRENFEQDLKVFSIEMDRFRNGLDLIKSNKNVSEAFKLMNQTFLNTGKGFNAWRLFQLIFIIMELPDIVDASGEGKSRYTNDIDIIYFPTGGGKTEAYLGAVVFTIFFDRLRGKVDGVSALTRFPLRLLSLQQIQRIADIFAQAELLRRNHPMIGSPTYAAFSTGYYVGSDNTPNKIYKGKTIGRYHSEKIDEISPIIENPDVAEKYLIIPKCPFCKSNNVKIIGDLEHLRIIHKCTNPDCGEEIPVYISDEEISRYLPTFIISTLDKMATAGWSRQFKNLLGQVSGKCPKHGYFSGDSCLYKKMFFNENDPNLCTIDTNLYQRVNLFDPIPSLIIQDEIHLIRESLGSYDSHYESFLTNYIERISNSKKKVKIIASSATISNFRQQITQLYLKNGNQFPASGPRKEESFYSYVDPDEMNRLIIGIMPHNKTIIFTVLDVIRFYSEIIQALKRNPKMALDWGLGFNNEQEVLETLSDYDLMLSYNLVKSEGDAVVSSIETMVNPRLSSIGLHELSTRTLTGDVSFRDVKEILAAIEKNDSNKQIDLISATSMISHGIDIDKLNFMIFRGMPRNNAEYIQAYSRVGRKYPGIVIIIFNHARERDQSYYKYFIKFHEFKDLLVEPVPINRWAKFSVERTLPGIFTASLLNYFSIKCGPEYKIHTPKGFSKALEERKFTEAELHEFVLDCYRCEEGVMGPYFRKIIEKKVDQYIYEILQRQDENFVNSAISDTPMKSLRDTDVPINISPSPKSHFPMQMVSASYTRSVGE